MLLLAPQPWEDAVLAKLTATPRDNHAMLELFDHLAPELWAYALHRARGPRAASRVVIEAFRTAAQQPTLFADRRVSIQARMLMLIYVATKDAPADTPISRGRHMHMRRGRLSA